MRNDLAPRLSDRARLRKEEATGRWILLFPEGLMNLNESAASILRLCDGRNILGEILQKLSMEFNAPVDFLAGDVETTLQKMESKGLIQWDEPQEAVPAPEFPTSPGTAAVGGSAADGYRPLGLLAELTYRCPLHCPYCSNPVWDKSRAGEKELTGEKWKEVLAQARALGVLHALFSGGEPLQRADLEELVAHAHRLGFYTNLITSGLGFSPPRAGALKEAGLDSVQLSFQAAEEAPADDIAGIKAHARKLEAAQAVRSVGLPLTVNIVLHRDNIGRVEEIITLAESLGAHRLELANTQYYGWAFRNRSRLLPTREQVLESSRAAAKARERLRGKMEVLYVIPDYFYDRPKPCMNGWGRRYITVNPYGNVLPCPTAYSIGNLKLENVREKGLDWIWNESESFNRFRGTEWMPEPCSSCDLREVDFGGCRCQAALLTGNPAATDPACGLSPDRPKLEAALEAPGTAFWDYRQNP